MGDDEINLVGLSYGTLLAQVVANTFPTRTGAIVLDGVVNPSWVAGKPGSISWIREGADVASWSVLKHFFELCRQAGPERCDFAGRKSPREKFATLAARLRKTPMDVPLTDGKRFSLGYPQLVQGALSNLYYGWTWPTLGKLLDAVYDGRLKKVGQIISDFQVPAGDTYDNRQDAGMAISCADTNNPNRLERYRQIAQWHDRTVAPYFGSPWAYKALNCAEWQGRSTERYTGPWDTQTTKPVLVIGMLHDPGTPYRNAVTVAHLLKNSSLLTVDGVGHGAFFGNDCVTQ